MKRSLIIAMIVATVIVAAGALLLTRTVKLDVPAEADYEFTVDVPMPRLRKILVRTNAVKKIIAMADAELLDQEWLDLNFQADRPLLNRDWKLDGSGQLKVNVNDPYIGNHLITLNQSVEINPDRLKVENDLDKPVGSIREYSSTLTLIPDASGNAKIVSSVNLRINTSANWFLQSAVENSIRDAALKSLKKQEQAIRELVEDHADELFILPGSGVEN